MDRVFAAFHAKARVWVRKADSEARVGAGLRTDRHPMHAAWVAGLGGATDYLGVPMDAQMLEKARSFGGGARENALVLREQDMPPDAASGTWLAWYGPLHQAPGLWVMPGSGKASQPAWATAVLPDGRLHPGFDALAGTRRQVDEGWAELLCAAEWDAGGVAMFDSRPSRHLNDCDVSFPGDSLEAEEAFAQALAALGYQYDFVDAERLQRAGARYRLLVLPAARAMADAEVAAVRAFVEAGGAVMADVAPATHDGHGIPRGKAALDDLFGVRHGGAFAPAELLLGTVSCVANRAARAVEGVLGREVEDVPIWITLPAGRALLLNHTVAPWVGGEAPAWSAPVAGALGEAGCSKAVAGREDEVLGWCERFHYRYGDADLYAVLAATDAPRRGIRLRPDLDKGAHAYDLLAGEPVSAVHRASFRVPAGQAALWSVLPYAVEGVALLVPEEAVRGERLEIRVAVEAESGTPGRHLVRLRMGPAGGAFLRHYSKTLVCEGGVGEAYIPLAWNEAQGEYSVEAQDLLTGLRTVRSVQVGG